jgi:hypothetical protein
MYAAEAQGQPLKTRRSALVQVGDDDEGRIAEQFREMSLHPPQADDVGDVPAKFLRWVPQ